MLFHPPAPLHSLCDPTEGQDFPPGLLPGRGSTPRAPRPLWGGSPSGEHSLPVQEKGAYCAGERPGSLRAADAGGLHLPRRGGGRGSRGSLSGREAVLLSLATEGQPRPSAGASPRRPRRLTLVYSFSSSGHPVVAVTEPSGRERSRSLRRFGKGLGASPAVLNEGLAGLCVGAGRCP